MSKTITTLDIHMKALDYLDEIKELDAEATDGNIAATTATILYMLMSDKEENENESI